MIRFLAAIVFGALYATGQDDISIRVTLDPPVIPFHQYATYTIAIEAPATAVVRIPSMLEKFGSLHVTSGPEHQRTPLDGDRVRIAESYRLEGIFPDDYFPEPVTVIVNDEARVVPSPALRVRDLTQEEQAEAEKYAAIADPPPVRPEWYRDWRVWSFVAIVGLLLAALARYLVTRRPRVQTVAVPLPPWEVAYQRLRELDMRGLSKSGRYGAFYVDLSAILRYYIEDRFHVHAPEQTTPEFLAAMSESGALDEEHQRFLAQFLRLSDRVKFAQYRPTIEEMDQSFVDVLKFVDDTVPKPEPVTEEVAA